jgi:cyclophilin family peptidyl-prolyl cis-trans isomerase
VLFVAGGVVIAASQRQQRDDQPVGVNYLKLQQILAIEDARAPLERDRLMLFDAASQPTPPKPDSRVRREDLSDNYPAVAVRAVGRLERQDLLSSLMTLFGSDRPEIRAAAVPGLFLTVRAAPRTDMPAPQVAAVVDALLERGPDDWAMLARLPLSTPEKTAALEGRLLVSLRVLFPISLTHAAAARGVEAMARYHRPLYRPSEETISQLRRVATTKDPNRSEAAPINAMAALIATGMLDEDTLDSVLADFNPELRRLAALALSGMGLQLEPAQRTAFIRVALNDRSPMVRYEAVRAWARRETQANGCAPLVQALTDPSLHVVLAAIDALGDQCKEDESMTDIMVAGLQTPSTVGSWHREAQTLVAFAKRAPDRAAMSMQAFRGHPVWQVRMYAARAAGLMKDVDTLERLAFDDSDNVRNAALPYLRVLRGDGSDKAVIDALGRSDYQLLRTAATLLKGTAPRREFADALVSALRRVTAEKKETSRDTRMALLERIAELGNANLDSALKPFGRDFDPVVAAEAARVFERLTGRRVPVEPQMLPRQAAPSAGELTERMRAQVYLDNGRQFRIELSQHRDTAPLTYARFVRLARAGYYNGLTFHRVVPNYIVQGGSPGANEYSGDGPFMRDEISTTWMSRGVVGISTRGRDTGDAQIFINLVDNPRLDFDYTVLGAVTDERDLEVLETIVEGTKIERIEIRR